jgi:glycogen debranching enzyme
MIEESKQLAKDYYILATSTRADERTRVIKHGDSFGVFDHSGMIHQGGMGELGLYHDNTRFVSAFEIAVERRRPMLLNSTVRRDNVLNVDLANPDLPDRPDPLARDTVHMFATSFLWDRGWHARLRLQNYAQGPVELELSMLFDADFADVFEVRGVRRLRTGTRRAPVLDHTQVVLGYDGLDGVYRATRLAFSPAPVSLSGNRASFAVRLAPRAEATIDVRVSFELSGDTAHDLEFTAAHARAVAAFEASKRLGTTLATGNVRFDEWIERSASDLQMMVTDTAHGPYPYAGVPWYSTTFGRDGIITALETLWIDPAIARGVLAFLAATQATELDRERDAEPGKVIHEARGGEMAALGEVPFGQYYGSVDATPLFVVLAGAYWRRTRDRELLEAIYPNIERAVGWIEDYGDLDGDGFVEYLRRSSRGLSSHGWKDSFDAISHADGELVTGPIALCEVQGYAYAARRAAAELARAMGRPARADELERDAEALRVSFERAFWLDELGTYALALDGDKRPCAVRASNAGHCLFAGIASPARAASVVERLLDDRAFSGWGIRTLEMGEARYNPISYHNGSVWPHDNALIAMGMARYGHKHACARVLAALFEATVHFDLLRIPELFCGFRQRPHEGPTLYPVACAPQAWAAGAVFMLIEACLGIELDAASSEIVFNRPILPRSIARLALRGLEINRARVDLDLVNHDEDVGVHLVRRTGDVAVVVTK